MGHLPKLIEDLALILIAGAIVTLLFKRIKQPLVLGYIIAGFLVSPHFIFIPNVVDQENVKTLAEIGVIFLLFSLGLEFSFKKLVRVGGAASITAFTEIIFIIFAGYFTGKWMGWSTMDSMFLGGMLASSSTTIILRAFDELGMKTKQFARIVFGVLVVEDIIVILLMVLLSTIAVTKEFEGMQILFTVLKLLFFLAMWFIVGIFLLPTFMRVAKKLLDEETLLILALGLCLGMVVLATKVGFSAELGAFVMGSIIAETTLAEKVEHLIKPVKDLFGAVFFVSVGMMIDPKAMAQYGAPIMVVTILVILGKMISTTVGALISGQPLKQSVQVGMSMAQIGEFAFIVATLGLSLGVISDFLFPIAVGASAVTTFTTPYLIRFSEPLYNWLAKLLPDKWVQKLDSYSSSTQQIQAESDWKIVFKTYLRIILTNTIILIALLLLSEQFILPFINRRVENDNLRNIFILIVSLGIAAPFFWAFMAGRPKNQAYKELWVDKKYNRGPLLIVELLRIILGILFMAVYVNFLVPARIALLVGIPITVLVILTFSKRIQRFYQRIEKRFMRNLNERETEEAEAHAAENNLQLKNSEMRSNMQAWDAHILEMVLNPQATSIGISLKNLKWREQFGINIVYIKRGEKIIHTPGRDNRLLPFDRVGILATDEQIAAFKPVFDAREILGNDDTSIDDIVLQKIRVDEHTQLKGLTIHNSGIREKTNGLVVGIEKEKSRILNPESSTVLEWGDIIWIVGNRKKMQQLIID